MLKLGLGHFVILQTNIVFGIAGCTFLRKHQIPSNYYKNNSLMGSILEILICDQVYQVMITKCEQLQKLQMSKI